MNTKHGLQKAIAKAGGVSALAKALNVKPPSVYDWIERRVPAERCLEIEREFGIPVEEIRADLPWHVVRGNSERAA